MSVFALVQYDRQFYVMARNFEEAAKSAYPFKSKIYWPTRNTFHAQGLEPVYIRKVSDTPDFIGLKAVGCDEISHSYKLQKYGKFLFIPDSGQYETAMIKNRLFFDGYGFRLSYDYAEAYLVFYDDAPRLMAEGKQYLFDRNDVIANLPKYVKEAIERHVNFCYACHLAIKK